MVLPNKKSVIHVLHVDDDLSLLEISKQILMDMGNFEIDNACCVNEAFKKLSTGNYDIVISDYEMPQKNGLQFLKDLREQNNEIPFILFTGKGREEVAIHALNLGANGYHNKQGNPETVYGELAHTIKQNARSKQAEKELLESETKFKLYIENSPSAVFIANPQGKYEYVNDAASRLLGYSKEELLEMSIPQIIFNEDPTLNLKKFEEVKVTGRSLSETVLKTKKGSPVYVILNSVKLPDGNLMAFCENITERKKAEDALKTGEQQFRQLFSHMPSGVAFYEAVDNGKDFVFRDFNAAAEKIEKIKREKVIGKRVTEVFPGVENFGLFNVFKQVWQTGEPEYYPSALYKDDKVSGTWRENWVYKLPNGNIVAIYNDITERKKIEMSLRQERDMLESVTKASGAGLVIVSKDYHVLWANDFIKRYKGDTIGKLCYASLNSLDTPCIDCGVAKIHAGKTTLDSHEYCSTTVDGNPYWVEIVATPLIDENGNVTSAVEIAVDITERKKNEEKLRESIRNNELINEKLQVVGGLTRHDVSNKLMVMKSNIYLLKKQLGDNPKLAKYLEDIDSSINQSAKIFEFSRLYERIGVEKPAKINVGESFNQAVVLLPNLGISKIVNDCQGLEVMADSLLKQLFYNFLDNSLKHGEKVNQMRLHYVKDGEGVKLFYEDNGVGVPEANKAKLFDKGFTTGKGSGLGLYLIKKMMDVYGWTITEEGEPGKGAKFTITIPKINQNKN